MQDFEEIFVATHGRRPSPTECAADLTYHALYARYAVSKKARERVIAGVGQSGWVLPTDEELRALDEGGLLPFQCGAGAGVADDAPARVSDAAHASGSGDSMWLRLMHSGAALGRKRPHAELELAAYPTRLHTQPVTYVNRATQTVACADFPSLRTATTRAASRSPGPRPGQVRRVTQATGGDVPMDVDCMRAAPSPASADSETERATPDCVVVS